jgi:hypothetical protein
VNDSNQCEDCYRIKACINWFSLKISILNSEMQTKLERFCESNQVFPFRIAYSHMIELIHLISRASSQLSYVQDLTHLPRAHNFYQTTSILCESICALFTDIAVKKLRGKPTANRQDKHDARRAPLEVQKAGMDE